jgi:hypothetical protein
VVRFAAVENNFLFPKLPDELWVITESSFEGQSGRDVKLTNHLYIMPRINLHGDFFHRPLRFYAIEGDNCNCTFPIAIRYINIVLTALIESS